MEIKITKAISAQAIWLLLYIYEPKSTVELVYFNFLTESHQ
jgi:hypothetical protein